MGSIKVFSIAGNALNELPDDGFVFGMNSPKNPL
jgi:hypothetical protein